MSAVANVAVNLDSRGVPAKLKQIADRGKEVDRSLNGVAAATTKAGREIKTAANGMQSFTDAAGRARKVNGQFVTTAEAAAVGIKKQGDAASGASSGLGNLAKGALKLAAAYATLNAAQSAVSAGIQRIESERRIQFLAKQYGEVDQLARAAANASDRFGQSQTSANRAIADVYARLRPVGVSLENIVSVYNGFNTAARISGSTAVEAENAFRQLSQALGSGALRGDEFNSIAEQVPGILTAISQETGVAQGKLREYAAEGKITADVVIGALQRIEKDGADQLTEALGGPAQAIKDFQNASEDVQVALTTAIVPEIARAFRDLAAIIVGLEPAIRYIGGLIADTLGSFRTLVESIRGGPVVERLRQGGQLGFNVGQEKEQLRSFFGKERFKQLEQQARETADATMTPFAEALGERLRVAIKVSDRAKEIEARQTAKIPTRPFRVGDVIDESTVAGGKVGGGAAARGAGAGAAARDAQRAADAAEREAEQRRINLRNQDQLIERLRAQVVLQNSFTDGDRIMNQLLLDQLEIRQDIENRMEGASTAMKQLLIQEADLRSRLAMDKAAEPFVRAGMNMGESLAEGIGKAKEETDLLNEALAGAGDIIGNQLRGAIDGLIDGTADWNKILQDTLSQLGSFFLNLGLNQLAGPAGSGGILSFLGFGTRASGGPVNANEPYIVGERGPELFMPFSSGMVLSNNDTREQLEQQDAVLRSNEATREQLEQQDAVLRSNEATREQLEQQDAAMRSNEATRQQLIKQQNTMTTNRIREVERTSLAMMASAGPIDVRYESSVINNVEYVTAEQHRKGMAQAAERGRALTLQALQNSVKTRSRVGI